MIYELVGRAEPLTQGDLLDDCPLFEYPLDAAGSPQVDAAIVGHSRVIVLTQACDLAQKKVSQVVVARVHLALDLVNAGILKDKLIREQVRRHQVYGWYFLPSDPGNSALPECVIDLRNLSTLPLALLDLLVAEGKRAARLGTPYREHLAKHFSDTYSRIPLPEPYETEP